MFLLMKLAMRPWRLAGWSQTFSALAVGFMLLMAGVLIWIQQGLKPVLNRIQHEQVVTAYLAPSIEPTAEQGVVDEIRLALGASAERSEIALVRSEQFVEGLGKQYPELAKELEDLGSELPTIAPRYVSVAGLLDEGAVEKVGAVHGVESIESSKDRYKAVIGAFSALRWVAGLLVMGLAMALLTGLVHLARTNSFIHRDALSLLRLLGASGHKLRVPGILSGISVGILGGTIASIGWLACGGWLATQVRSLSPLLREMAAPPSIAYAAALLGAGALIGMMAGLLAGTPTGNGRG